MPAKMLEACQETPNRQKDCLSLTQRPVKSLNHSLFDRFSQSLDVSLVDTLLHCATECFCFAADP